MTTAEILRAARAKIEQGRCQRYYAQDALGRKIMSVDPSAERFCALGAIHCVSPYGDPRTNAKTALTKITKVAIADFNDAPGRTQAEVLAAFDKAIALAESEGA